MIDLRHGDCLEIMQEIPEKTIDLILCDLPYGTTACAWDSIIPFDKLWELYWKILKPNKAIVLTSSQPFTTALISSQIKHFKYCWYWKKNFSTNFLHAKRQPLRNFEDVCVFIKGKSFYFPQKSEGHPPTQATKGSSIGVLWSGKNVRDYKGGDTTRMPTQFLEFNAVDPRKRSHPTQKPVELMEYLIKTYTNEGDLVLDNCMGSGTTGVACLNIKRNFIGIEKDDTYFNIAKNRILNKETSLGDFL